MRLIFVRHGECERLLESVYNGWKDYNLTLNGKQQAAECGKILSNKYKKIDVVYTSLLKRTRNTANIIMNQFENKNNIIKSTILLNERHYGKFQGKNRDELRKIGKYKEIFDAWYELNTIPPKISNYEYTKLLDRYKNISEDLKKYSMKIEEIIPRAESLLELQKRLDTFINKILIPDIKSNFNNDSNILIVTHSNNIKLFIKMLEKISDSKIAMKNLVGTCGVFAYEIDSTKFLSGKYEIKNKEIINNNWYA